MKWTQSQYDFLRKHYGRIKSGDITKMFNKEFGTNVSRDSIIGAAHRKNLHVSKPIKKNIKIEAQNIRKIASRLNRSQPSKYDELPCFNEPSGGVTIFELETNQCPWPIRQNHYCGKAGTHGGYCEYHKVMRHKGSNAANSEVIRRS